MSNKICKGRAICPASCGEVIQGLIDNNNLLITCPISLYSTVEVEVYEKIEKPKEIAKNQKALEAAKKTLSYFGRSSWDVDIKLNSNIPEGIGLASSTADITATCLAVASALGKIILPDTIADIALSIEPSDGTMFSRVMLFDYISGNVRQSLGLMPEMNVLILDTYEEVDTIEFEKHDLKQLRRSKEAEVREALNLALASFKLNKEELLGQAMIKSALAHQRILFKPHLNEVINLGKRNNAIGVNVAHSGSAMGIFFDKNYSIKKDFFYDLDKIMRNHKKKYRILKAKTGNIYPRILY